VPRIHFQLQLAELKDKLLAMAALAQQAVESAVDAFLQRDKGLCQYVKQNESAIDAAQQDPQGRGGRSAGGFCRHG